MDESGLRFQLHAAYHMFKRHLDRSGLPIDQFLKSLDALMEFKWPRKLRDAPLSVAPGPQYDDATIEKLESIAKRVGTLEQFVVRAVPLIREAGEISRFKWPDGTKLARFESGINVPGRLLRKVAAAIPLVGLNLLALYAKNAEAAASAKFDTVAYGVFNWRTGTSYASRWHSKRESGKDLPTVGDHTGGYGTVCATVQDDVGTTIESSPIPDSQA